MDYGCKEADDQFSQRLNARTMQTFFVQNKLALSILCDMSKSSQAQTNRCLSCIWRGFLSLCMCHISCSFSLACSLFLVALHRGMKVGGVQCAFMGLTGR